LFIIINLIRLPCFLNQLINLKIIMKKFNLTLIVNFIIVFCICAQKGIIKFEKTTHTFGSINEADGPAIYEFQFTNAGTDPVIISNVKASCGCTTPGWSKEPVMPGKDGFVKVKYNPANRPGAFTKTLTITANTSPVTQVLYIKGNVVPKPKSPTQAYPKKIGNIRLKSNNLSLGRVKKNKIFTKEFTVYNDSEEPVTFTDKIVTPKHISITIEPKTIKPKEKGKIKVTYNPIKKADWGYVSYGIELYTNEVNDAKKVLNVVGTIDEDFSSLSEEEKAGSPKILFEKKSYDFGEVKEGKKVTTTFKVTNNGKQKLILRNVTANCECTTAKPSKTLLKAGESIVIDVTFDSAGRLGKQVKTITVICNDPSSSYNTLRITANVIKEKSGDSQ